MPLYLSRTNVIVGGSNGLGDNGIGEVQFVNAISPPTTNPTGGAVVYANAGTVYSRDINGYISPMSFGPEPAVAVTGALCETVRRLNVSSTFTSVTGNLYLASVFLAAGQTVGHVGFVSVAASASPTHWWTCLLDNTYTQRAHSADQTTTAIGANTWNSLPMVTPFTTTYTGTYYLGVMQAGTIATVACSSGLPLAALLTGTNAIGTPPNGLSSTGLTTPGTDGTTTYTAPTTAINTLYMFALP